MFTAHVTIDAVPQLLRATAQSCEQTKNNGREGAYKGEYDTWCELFIATHG